MTRRPDVLELFGGLGGPPAAPGTVHLVGGGPGDPGLLTLRAAVLLSTCDVVAYDRLSPPAALELVPPDAERVLVGKRSGEQGYSRAAVDALLISRAQAGKAVVRLKGGDPFVFGRGGEEASACTAAGLPVEIVSGVTSAIAVPASAGIPVTHRTVAAGFAVVAGHEDPAKPSGYVDYTSLARFPGTLVFLMGVQNIGKLADELIAHGRDPSTPVALVRWGTTPWQQTAEGTLATIAEEVERRGLVAPAVAVVGDVVRLRASVAWRERLPLLGKTVLVLRTLDRVSSLTARLRGLGAEALQARVMRTLPGDPDRLRRAAHDLAAGAYAVVVLSSPMAAHVLADTLEAAGLDARALAGARLVTLGKGAARQLGARLAVRPDLAVASIDALAEALPPGAGHALVLTQDQGDPRLPAVLTGHGYAPDLVTTYVTATAETLPEDVIARLVSGEVDLVAVASSSSARHFAALTGSLPVGARVVSIGPQTSATCREAGLPVHAEADPHDEDGLVDALVLAAADVPRHDSPLGEVPA